MGPKRVLSKFVILGALFMALAALVGARVGTQVSAAIPPISPRGATFTPTPVPSCTPAWTIVNSPDTPGSDNRLHGMAAISPDDVWAVGIVGNGRSGSLPLMLHWEGTQWTSVP